MAAGDILSVTVRADGWEADVVMEGLATGGTYNFGLGANGDPATGTPKIKFTVVSLGFDNTGAATTITRTVYGTKQVRKPYPNQAQNQESNDGSNTTVRIALSDYIYAKDATGAGNSGTAPVVNILAGFYTSGGTPNNASGAGFAVTNSSAATYPKVVGNWSWPGFNRVTGDFPLRAVAFHANGMNGRPVACVKFTAADTHGHTATTTVIDPTDDNTVGDAVPVVEYVGTMAVSSLTTLDVLTCNFQAFPWIGDTDSILDTTVGGTAQPTPLYGPITQLLDKSGTYGVTVACVDPAGNDSGGSIGQAVDIGSYVQGTTRPFLTIGKAAAAIAAYNNSNRSRNTVGGGIIYLNNGTYAWAGTANSYGTTPSDWLKITRSPASSSRAAVVIASQSNDRVTGGRQWFYDVTITATSNLWMSSAGVSWFDNCTIDQTGVSASYAFIYSTTHWYVTRCTITKIQQGLRPYSTENSPICIVRGNTIAQDGVGALFAYTVLGNVTQGTRTLDGLLLQSYGGQTIPTNTQPIIAFNKLLGMKSSSSAILSCFPTTATSGMALVQNVIENISTGSANLVAIAGDGSTGANAVNNVIIWNNVLVGQRINLAYNDTAANAPVRTKWSVKNNLADDYNLKSDVFASDGGNVGNWSQLYGVNHSGNVWAETTNIGAPAQYLQEFAGLKCIANGASQAATYLAFTNRLAFAGGSSTAGQGSYNLKVSSPAVGLQRDLVIPIDIAGVRRSPFSAAGAYHLDPAEGFLAFMGA